MISVPCPKRPDFDALMKRAREIVARMSPAEKAEMLRRQAQSWARGEAGLGSDADEAAYTKALSAGDEETLERLRREADERIARVDAMSAP